METETDKLIARADVPAYLAAKGLTITVSYLTKLAHTGGGPAFKKWGNRRCYYSPADLDAWVRSRLSPSRFSTSEAA